MSYSVMTNNQCAVIQTCEHFDLIRIKMMLKSLLRAERICKTFLRYAVSILEYRNSFSEPQESEESDLA